MMSARLVVVPRRLRMMRPTRAQRQRQKMSPWLSRDVRTAERLSLTEHKADGRIQLPICFANQVRCRCAKAVAVLLYCIDWQTN